jgi:hypothetical protein
MNSVGHLLQSLQGGVFMNSQLPSASLSFPAYVTVPGDDKADASLGEIYHQVGKLAGAGSVRGGHPLPRSGTNKSICQTHGFNDG